MCSPSPCRQSKWMHKLCRRPSPSRPSNSAKQHDAQVVQTTSAMSCNHKDAHVVHILADWLAPTGWPAASLNTHLLDSDPERHVAHMALHWFCFCVSSSCQPDTTNARHRLRPPAATLPTVSLATTSATGVAPAPLPLSRPRRPAAAAPPTESSITSSCSGAAPPPRPLPRPLPRPRARCAGAAAVPHQLAQLLGVFHQAP